MPVSLADAWVRLRELASASDAPIFLVGGAVRDAILGREIREADLAVAGDLNTFAERAAAELYTRPVTIGREHPVVRLPLAEGHIDLTVLGDSLRSNLAARDYTVDALGLPLASVPPAGPAGVDAHTVIDQYSGVRDLQTRTIRMISPAALAADPVRTVRAVRLACELDFTIEAATLLAIRNTASELERAAPDRVGTEIERIFASRFAARGVRLLDDSGLIDICFPALVACRDVEQRPVHQNDVYEHALISAEWMDVLLATDGRELSGAQRRIWEMTWGESSWPDSLWGPCKEQLAKQATAMRLATLLHDLGKPLTRTQELDGRTRFLGHAALGAEIAVEQLRHWRLPNRLVARVGLLVEEHMRPGQVMAPGQAPSSRALYRFQRALRDATPDACFLFLADSLGTAGAETLVATWPAYVDHVRRIVCWHPPPAAAGIRRLIDGESVMAATGLAPGREIGRLLAAIEEAAAAGEITTADAAIAFARRMARES